MRANGSGGADADAAGSGCWAGLHILALALRHLRQEAHHRRLLDADVRHHPGGRLRPQLLRLRCHQVLRRLPGDGTAILGVRQL